MNARGFTLIEVLIAILILAVAIVTLMAGIGNALSFSKRVEETTESIFLVEEALFRLETGIRSDWITYGGEENLSEERRIKIKSRAFREKLQSVDLSLLAKEKEALHLRVFLIEGGISR